MTVFSYIVTATGAATLAALFVRLLDRIDQPRKRCTAACRPGELSLVYFHSPDGDAIIMPIRRHIANSTDEQEEQE